MKRLALALAVVSALFAGCQLGTRDADDQAPAPAIHRLAADGSIHLSAAEQRALGLQVEQVRRGTLPDTAIFYGTVRAKSGTEVAIPSPVDGRIAAAPRVLLGTKVSAGTALLEIAPVLAAGERVSLGVQGAEARGQIAATEKELTVRQAALQRATELASSKIISTEKLQEAEAAVASSRARLDALRVAQQLQVSGTGRPMTLVSPIAGTVVRLRTDVGAPVKSGDMVADVLGEGARAVDVAVPSSLGPGSGYEVQAGKDWVAAKLLFAGGTVEADGARHVLLEVEDEAALLPGATTAVRVALGSAEGLVLPESAVVPVPGGERVYVRVAADTFRPVMVHVAARLGGKVRIDSGVKESDPVVSAGAMALRGEELRSQLQEGG